MLHSILSVCLQFTKSSWKEHSATYRTGDGHPLVKVLKAGSTRFAVSPPLIFSFITSSLKMSVTAQISSETQVLDNTMFLWLVLPPFDSWWADLEELICQSEIISVTFRLMLKSLKWNLKPCTGCEQGLGRCRLSYLCDFISILSSRHLETRLFHSGFLNLSLYFAVACSVVKERERLWQQPESQTGQTGLVGTSSRF